MSTSETTLPDREALQSFAADLDRYISMRPLFDDLMRRHAEACEAVQMFFGSLDRRSQCRLWLHTVGRRLPGPRVSWWSDLELLVVGGPHSVADDGQRYGKPAWLAEEEDWESEHVLMLAEVVAERDRLWRQLEELPDLEPDLGRRASAIRRLTAVRDFRDCVDPGARRLLGEVANPSRRDWVEAGTPEEWALLANMLRDAAWAVDGSAHVGEAGVEDAIGRPESASPHGGRYFVQMPADVPKSERAQLSHSEVAAQLARFLYDYPDATRDECAEALNVSGGTISKNELWRGVAARRSAARKRGNARGGLIESRAADETTDPAELAMENEASTRRQ